VRYENLLIRSFRILRGNLWLWFLALRAGEGSSGGGGGGANAQFQPGTTRPAGSVGDFGWVQQWLADRAGLFAEIAAILLVVGLAWFLISCVASGALLGGAARIDAGEKLTLGRAWRFGVGAFGRVLRLKLLFVAGLLGPALLLALPPLAGLLDGSRGLLVGLVIDLPLLIAYFYWAAFLHWFAELALRACVLDRLGAWAAVRAAWALLKRRFPRIALTTLVFIGVGLGMGLLTSIVFALVEAPFVGPVLAAIYRGLLQGQWSDVPGTIGLWLAILIPLSLAVSSAVGAYFAIAWTLAYRRFDVEGEIEEPPSLAA